jgi:hypothetical protein
MLPIISRSLDRQLNTREQLVLRLHLLICVWCVRYLSQITSLRQYLLGSDGYCADEELTLTPQARQRMQGALNATTKDIERKKNK